MQPATATAIDAPRPLLARLRRGDVDVDVVDPAMEAGWRRVMVATLLAHRAEFPARVRAAIGRSAARTAAAPDDDAAVLAAVRREVTEFFFGMPDADGDGDGDADAGEARPPFHWWHGPNSDVDAPEEVETALRFFPSVLVERRGHPHPLFPQRRFYTPIWGLLHCSRAMAFIPLLAELGVELGTFADRGGLVCAMHNVVTMLVCNVVVRDDLDEEASGKLDEDSVAIMTRLRDKGLMTKEDVHDFDLTLSLLYHANYRTNYRYRRRLRFLLDWDPSVLRECGRGDPLLYHFVRRLCATDDGRLPPGALRRFGDILGFGMSHHPAELGFLFHGSTFRLACELFGADEVGRTVENKLLGVVEQEQDGRNNSPDDENSTSESTSSSLSLAALFFAAATNEEISLDGAYAVFRRNPMALLP